MLLRSIDGFLPSDPVVHPPPAPRHHPPPPQPQPLAPSPPPARACAAHSRMPRARILGPYLGGVRRAVCSPWSALERSSLHPSHRDGIAPSVAAFAPLPHRRRRGSYRAPSPPSLRARMRCRRLRVPAHLVSSPRSSSCCRDPSSCPPSLTTRDAGTRAGVGTKQQLLPRRVGDTEASDAGTRATAAAASAP